jgi:hypothetical protein
MSNRKQRKKALENSWNPGILTFAQVLALADQKSSDPNTVRNNAALAVNALHNRVTCRFTGPSNFDRLTYGERLVWDLVSMHCEVLNGGFHQYLTNSTGESGEDVKKHLSEIGAAQALELFQRLSKIFPRSRIPRDRNERTALLEKWEGTHPHDKLIDELTSRYYSAPDDLDALILAYARKHPADFAEPSDDIVTRHKRKEPITAEYCGTAEPEWLEAAEQSLAALEQFALANPADKWRDEEYGPIFKKLADSGERKKAILMYKDLYMCSLREAKAGLENLLQRQGGQP